MTRQQNERRWYSSSCYFRSRLYCSFRRCWGTGGPGTGSPMNPAGAIGREGNPEAELAFIYVHWVVRSFICSFAYSFLQFASFLLLPVNAFVRSFVACCTLFVCSSARSLFVRAFMHSFHIHPFALSLVRSFVR